MFASRLLGEAHGLKCSGKELHLAYCRPNAGMNPEAAQRYAASRHTITRQVVFSSKVLKRSSSRSA